MGFPSAISSEGHCNRSEPRRLAALACGLERVLLLRRDRDVAKRDGAVIALEHERADGDFTAERAAGRALRRLGVLVDDLAVQFDLEELGVGSFLFAVEARGLEIDDVLLPFAGLLARV